MQILIIIILSVVLAIVLFQMFRYKIGLMFVSEYMKKYNLEPTESEIAECKKDVIDTILRKKG